MIAETERLRIRKFEMGDLDALAPIMAKPEMFRHSYRGPQSREETRAMLERFLQRYERDGSGPYAVLLKETGALIGFAGLPVHEIDGVKEIEVGYGIDPAYQGQGYAAEATKACRDYAFQRLGAKRVVSIIKKDNEASLKVAAKLGMTFEKSTLFYGAAVLIYSVSHERAQESR
jgi:[ribosomal protein S5]-alanine N-acetyltransferase